MAKHLTNNLAILGLFHETFFNVIYGKMAVNHGIFEIMSKYTVKIKAVTINLKFMDP